MHYRWNLVYVPWVNKDVRRSEFISNIISKPISYWLHHIIVWYSVLVFEAWQETRKRRAFMPPNKVYSRRTWTNRNYWHHPISCHSDLKATESSTPPDKVSLVPPSAPPLVRHPALSITTNLFGSAATRLTTRYYCFIPCFLPEDAVKSWRLMWYVQGLRHWHYFWTHLLLVCRSLYHQFSWENDHGSSMTGVATLYQPSVCESLLIYYPTGFNQSPK